RSPRAADRRGRAGACPGRTPGNSPCPLGPRAQCQEDLLALLVDAPRAEDRLAGEPRAEPLGDAVDEEVQELVLRQAPGREHLVLLPEPLGHLAHGRPRQERAALLVGERRLDVPRREPAGIHLDGQPLKLLGAPFEPLAHPRSVWLPQVRHLRRRVLDRSLGALQPPTPIAVSIPWALPVAAPVVHPPEPVLYLAFKHFLDELAHAEADLLPTARL